MQTTCLVTGTKGAQTTKGMILDSPGLMAAMMTVATDGGMTQSIQTTDRMTPDSVGFMATMKSVATNRNGMTAIRTMNGTT